MAQYSEKTQQLVDDTLRKMNEGQLYNNNGQKITERDQAIQFALSQARDKGYSINEDQSWNNPENMKKEESERTGTGSENTGREENPRREDRREERREDRPAMKEEASALNKKETEKEREKTGVEHNERTGTDQNRQNPERENPAKGGADQNRKDRT